jgi:hypothetical protein
MKYQYQVIIGDWSKDGHNQSDHFIFNCTHPDKDIHKAYIEAVKKSQIGLHRKGKERYKFETILEDYEDSKITGEQMGALKAIGVDYERLDGVEQWDDEGTKYGVSPEGVAQLFLEMVRSQLPGFEYEFVEPKPINVHHDKFPHSFGYGCYH